MNREYRKWFSRELNRDMEMLVFGQGGTPILVFPTSMGRFFDYEDRGMIAAISQKYESGELQAFCVDSVDAESFSAGFILRQTRTALRAPGTSSGS